MIVNSVIFKRLFGVIILCSLVCALSACHDEPNPVDSETEYSEIGIDELSNFHASFLGHTVDGSDIFIRGGVLDKAYPNILSIVVENKEEAQEIFRNALPAEPRNAVVENQDGSIEFCPADTLGNKQGKIIFSPGKDKYPYASVRFSDGASMGEIDTIEFIDQSAWPDNDDYVSPYMPGQYDYGSVSGDCVCVKAATSTEAGILMFIWDRNLTFTSKWQIKAYDIPTRAQLKEVSDIVREDWEFYQEIWASGPSGVTVTDNDEFWIAEIKDKFLWKENASMCLKTGKVTVNKFSVTGPERRIISVFYFNDKGTFGSKPS